MKKRKVPLPPTALAFFADRVFFSRDEFAAAYAAAGHSASSVHEVLAYYSGTGVLISIRRGLYLVAGATFDPFVLPSKLHPRAVIAYDGAAAFHGLAGVGNSFCFLSPRALPRYTINETIYRAIADPSVTKADPKHPTIHAYPHGKQKLAVTSYERTLADCLDRIDLGPNVTDLALRFFGAVERRLDLRRLQTYATEHCGAVGCARLGLLLSGHPRYREARDVLDALAAKVQARTTYATHDREPGGTYYARWRLMVPKALSDHIPAD